MSTKRVLSDKGWVVHRLYATVLRGEVSDASVQGYLRAASQIEDIWQQIEERLAAFLAQGVAPWEAYARLRYPLAFIRAARAYQVFVNALLEADSTFDQPTAGYLPRITAEQADALGAQMQPAVQAAIATLQNPAYVPQVPLPLVLGPRIENEGRPCPVTHLHGIIAAAREVHEWAAELIAQYEQTVKQATGAVPAEVTAHLAALQGFLAQADSQRRFGADFAGQVTQGEATPEMHVQAGTYLWEALQTCFLLNQAVAMPDLLRQDQAAHIVLGAPSSRSALGYRDRRIRPEDLWQYAAPSARAELEGTAFGTEAMERMWRRMGGLLSAGAQQYLDEVAAAVGRGEVFTVAALAVARTNLSTVHSAPSHSLEPPSLRMTNFTGTSTRTGWSTPPVLGRRAPGSNVGRMSGHQGDLPVEDESAWLPASITQGARRIFRPME